MQESRRGPFEAFKQQDGVTATNSDVEGEISLADMNPDDIRVCRHYYYYHFPLWKIKFFFSTGGIETFVYAIGSAQK